MAALMDLVAGDAREILLVLSVDSATQRPRSSSTVMRVSSSGLGS